MAINIHIIAPYPAMVPIIKECLAEYRDVNIGYSVGDLEIGAEIAIGLEQKGTDVIISRGGTAQLIRKHVNVPVIDMQLSGYDLLRSLTLASNIQNKTAIVGFSNITSAAKSIIDVLELPMEVYTVNDASEVAPLLLKLKDLGYDQILGDVVTVNTSQVYGLNGMLLQSGKESITKSIEEALFLCAHLNKKDQVIHAMKQLILKDHPNFIILDEQDQLIIEHLTHFDSNPLSNEDMYLLNTNLSANHQIHQVIEMDENNFVVTGYRMESENQSYKIYLLTKTDIEQKQDHGITVHHQIEHEPIITNSNTMSSFIEKLTALFKHCELVYLFGEKGTGKKFVVKQLHSKLSNGLLATVDGKDFDPNKREQMLEVFPPNIQTIMFANSEKLLHDASFQEFLTTCQKRRIQIVLISEKPFEIDDLLELDLNMIKMPSINDRKEDIHELSLLFLANYHQKYGTTAMKLTEEALDIIENQNYKHHIHSLKKLIKHIAFNEDDYIVHKDTVKKVLHDHVEFTSFPIHGTLKEIETEIIKQVLIEEGHNQTKAAKRLGINRSTLWRKLKD